MNTKLTTLLFLAATLTAIAQDPPCPCGMIACVCNLLKRHQESCLFRTAAAGPVGIPCEHGRDCCPTCDPCVCERPAV
jgi:hypothetical protein